MVIILLLGIRNKILQIQMFALAPELHFTDLFFLSLKYLNLVLSFSYMFILLINYLIVSQFLIQDKWCLIIYMLGFLSFPFGTGNHYVELTGLELGSSPECWD